MHDLPHYIAIFCLFAGWDLEENLGFYTSLIPYHNLTRRYYYIITSVYYHFQFQRENSITHTIKKEIDIKHPDKQTSILLSFVIFYRMKTFNLRTIVSVSLLRYICPLMYITG